MYLYLISISDRTETMTEFLKGQYSCLLLLFLFVDNAIVVIWKKDYLYFYIKSVCELVII